MANKTTSIKVTHQINDRTSVEFESDEDTEIFRCLSRAQEIFSDTQCGCCKSTDGRGNKFGIKYVVRENQGNDYYELRCLNPFCRAKLEFGQNKIPKGGLYPRRKAKESENGASNYLPNNGWVKYDPSKDPKKNS